MGLALTLEKGGTKKLGEGKEGIKKKKKGKKGEGWRGVLLFPFSRANMERKCHFQGI